MDRPVRTKRSVATLDILRTSQGYSLIEGEELINRASLTPSQTMRRVTTNIVPTMMKSVSKQSNKNVNCNKQTDSKFYLLAGQWQQKVKIEEKQTKIQYNELSSWFNVSKIHNKELKQLEQWAEEIPMLKKMTQQQRETLYQQYRNTIIELGAQENITFSRVKEYICADSYWLLKLYCFLAEEGLINSPLRTLQSSHSLTDLPLLDLVWKKEGADSLLMKKHQMKMLSPKHSNKKKQDEQQLEMLMENMLPLCDYCGMKCKFHWFQFKRQLDPNQIASLMRNVSQRNPSLNQKNYEFMLCTTCFCDARFPVFFTHQDFKKVSVEENLFQKSSWFPKLQQGKTIKTKIEKKLDDGVNESENIIVQAEQQSALMNHSPLSEKQIFQKLYGGMKKKKIKEQITLKQTEKMLQLIQDYGLNWEKILLQLKKQKMCLKLGVEELVSYFVQLPLNHSFALRMQLNDSIFIKHNQQFSDANILKTLIQKRLIQAKELSKHVSQIDFSVVSNCNSWKTLLDKAINVQLKSWKERLNTIQRLQSNLRGFDFRKQMLIDFSQ